MRKNTFIELVKEARFRDLFITEMGWNNYRGQAELPLIDIDGISYQLFSIAERNGFQILTCEVDEIPTTSTCKRIDTKLRRSANDYIAIYIKRGTEHHQWVAPVRNVEKRDLVTIEYESADKADFVYSKIDGLSFGNSEHTTIVDVKERVQGTFAINSEKITKDFYAGFRKEHNAFALFITGIDDAVELKNNRNKQWYTSVMLNRLMFCYFIQKKGFLDGNVNYLRDKLKWCQDERGENRFFKSFYQGFLMQLFQDGLNSPTHNRDFETIYGRIPYLNGGMFDRHQIELDYHDIDIADEAFEHLFEFFDKWRWHLDTRISATGKDINPDVLGYIFEQYINDRAQMGAYYTKEDITEYIGRNCILPFLLDKVKNASQEMGNMFSPQGFVWQTFKASGDKYIFDAVKQGYTSDWKSRIPAGIADGLDTTSPNLLERRKDWNNKTPEPWALPTEIWRETIDRLQRCDTVLHKISEGEITQINDFITYNLDIRSFVADLLATTDNHRFVGCFYHALQKITILDPTCGSGAFLFAAMNILEPLYEVCIDRMMEWSQQNPHLFKEEMGEIQNRYRSNIQYFIYKSIILRNLYGVDIMHEATEIAKLRLFLKMVAVVEVDRRAPNLGLDPLPDIDFNIRCGNTLVGYATEDEIVAGSGADLFTQQEFRERVETEMQKVSKAYDIFRTQQLADHDDLESVKTAKIELKERLTRLTNLLDRQLFSATGGTSFEAWEKTHQPFHWIAEYYQIMHDQGGFDVIIGNPPYVVYTEGSGNYTIDRSYKTMTCANLYAYCIERSHYLINGGGRFGMIVPNSCISANKMLPVQRIISDHKRCWVSNYSWRPSKLFEGANMLLAIILNAPSESTVVMATIYHRWYNEYRDSLFATIHYTNVSDVMIDGSIPKMPSVVASQIINKMYLMADGHILPEIFGLFSSYRLYYFRAVLYWFKVLDQAPIFKEDGVDKATGEMKPIYFDNNNLKNAVIAILSSNTFFLNYVIWSSCQVVNSRDFNIPIDVNSISKDDFKHLVSIGEKLQDDYQKNSLTKERHYSKKGRSFTMLKQYFYIKYSKSTIDEIDKILAQYYNFTDEELDFIINYDIKYRMGNELND